MSRRRDPTSHMKDFIRRLITNAGGARPSASRGTSNRTPRYARSSERGRLCLPGEVADVPGQTSSQQVDQTVEEEQEQVVNVNRRVSPVRQRLRRERESSYQPTEDSIVESGSSNSDLWSDNESEEEKEEQRNTTRKRGGRRRGRGGR
ncbi:hypothetical protein ERJ75_001344200 [Trypanosoma vivax]|nr:hypothetical protein TRVL_08080 [Trypanosoma vivax]KAH8607953.1 hypothetical protein ERJ75_001344200 [Trypanosoma vivax]